MVTSKEKSTFSPAPSVTPVTITVLGTLMTVQVPRDVVQVPGTGDSPAG